MELQRHFENPEIIENPIYRLLLRTGEGKSVIKFYMKKGTLKKNLRNLLSRIIVNAEKDRRLAGVLEEPGNDILESFSIDRELFITWADQIVKVFPSECKGIYYSPFKSIREDIVQPDGSITIKKRKINASGTLYEHYVYLLNKLRGQNLLRNCRSDEVTAVPVVIPEEAVRAVEWLNNHLGPADVLKTQWQLAYEARKSKFDEGCSIYDYFETFPALKGPIGCELLSLDFNRLHPGCEHKFFDRWSRAKDILIAALNDCRQLGGEDSGYYHALPALTGQNKDSILLYLLPYIINQPRGKRGPRISTREKQESFFIHAQTASDIEPSLNRLRDVCIASNLTFQPIPVFVGPLANIETFYIYINNSVNNPTIYQTDSALNAIDLTFKIIFALNSKYMERSGVIWTFIQKAFYDINLSADRCSRETVALIDKILRACRAGVENIPPN